MFSQSPREVTNVFKLLLPLYLFCTMLPAQTTLENFLNAQ
jgi:hypothetical protein